jgi:hypothetical protein
MKIKETTSLALFTICFAVTGFSQSDKEKSKAYVTTGGELIFSFANVDQHGNSLSSTMRFSPVVNLQVMINKDVNKNFGLFTGLALRNVGYITKGYVDPSDSLTYKKKFRSYNLGIPVGFKVGNLEKTFFYAGYEIEFAMSYKEKTYVSGDKTGKITGWFTDRQEIFQHGFLVGIQFPYGTNIKFKYYLSEFNNEDYRDNAGRMPYAGLKANIFYISLNFFLFKNFEIYYK